MKKMKSSQDMLKEKYRDSITCFLKDNTLYDCLSHNNQIGVIDQSFSCMDVFRIFIEHHMDEVIFWNSDTSTYDGLFTHTDLIKVLLRFYKNVVDDVPNGFFIEYQKPFRKNYINTIEEELSEEEDQVQTSLKNIQLQINEQLNEKQRSKLMADLQNITIKQWFTSIYHESDSLQAIGLIKGKMEDKLNEACKKIIKQNVYRIIVIDEATKMMSGIIQQRDILVFLIKGFSQYFNDLQTQSGHENQLNQQQHELEIGYFFDENKLGSSGIFNATQKKFICQSQQSCSLYQVFFEMINIYKSRSMPIINEQNKYIGTIHRRDIRYVFENYSFDWLARTAGEFYEYISKQKKQCTLFQIQRKELFHMKQTVKEVVENLVLSESCQLVCLNENNTIKQVLTITDIFNFFLGDN